ncbi:MAG: BsuPI-related putative proteinase inhibitor [Sciscionella sp.]
MGEPSYQVGQHPQFAMTVVNIGKQSCTLDVGGGQRELLVQAADGTREWSNTDCLFAPRKPDVQTLRAGQQLHYGLTWAGRSSQQGCPVQRHRIPAGKYTLTARLGALTSAKTPFTLT